MHCEQKAQRIVSHMDLAPCVYAHCNLHAYRFRTVVEVRFVYYGPSRTIFVVVIVLGKNVYSAVARWHALDEKNCTEAICSS